MKTAHTVCPYSKATRGNIEVKLFLGDNPLASSAWPDRGCLATTGLACWRVSRCDR